MVAILFIVLTFLAWPIKSNCFSADAIRAAFWFHVYREKVVLWPFFICFLMIKRVVLLLRFLYISCEIAFEFASSCWHWQSNKNILTWIIGTEFFCPFNIFFFKNHHALKMAANQEKRVAKFCDLPIFFLKEEEGNFISPLAKGGKMLKVFFLCLLNFREDGDVHWEKAFFLYSYIKHIFLSFRIS